MGKSNADEYGILLKEFSGHPSMTGISEQHHYSLDVLRATQSIEAFYCYCDVLAGVSAADDERFANMGGCVRAYRCVGCHVCLCVCVSARDVHIWRMR